MEAKPVVIGPGTPRKPGRVKQGRTIQRAPERHTAGERPNARIRSGLPTGAPPHFKLWMADAKVKSTLQRMRTAKLAEDAKDLQASAALAILATQRNYRNLFAVVDAKREDLLAIRGLGEKRLDALQEYLRVKQVSVRWAKP